eukprot:5147063-Pleurochrysis_carterae.AAC.2
MDIDVQLAQHVTQHIAFADPLHTALLESLRSQGVKSQALLDCCVTLDLQSSRSKVVRGSSRS